MTVVDDNGYTVNCEGWFVTDGTGFQPKEIIADYVFDASTKLTEDDVTSITMVSKATDSVIYFYSWS